MCCRPKDCDGIDSEVKHAPKREEAQELVRHGFPFLLTAPPQFPLQQIPNSRPYSRASRGIHASSNQFVQSF